MKLLFDFFPILLFFIAYKLGDIYVGHEQAIYVATAVAIAASALQVAFYWLRHRRFETMHLVTLGLMVVLGGATLILQNDTFIKWKPTVVNWLFAAAFLGSQWFTEKSLVQRMMGKSVQLPGAVWGRLNVSWSLFFIALGGLNLYVAFNFDTDTWVNFKLFGMMGLTFVFIIAQAFYMAPYMAEEVAEGPVEDDTSNNSREGKS